MLPLKSMCTQGVTLCWCRDLPGCARFCKNSSRYSAAVMDPLFIHEEEVGMKRMDQGCNRLTTYSQ